MRGKCLPSLDTLYQRADCFCSFVRESATDFTTVDPNKSFTIYWRAFDVSLLYSPIDTSKACYRIQINSPGNGRIWVNDG